MEVEDAQYRMYHPGEAYWFQVIAYEDDGVWLAYAKNLMGAMTYGHNMEHALEMMRECIQGLLGAYILCSQEIPFTETDWYEIEGNPHLREWRVMVELEDLREEALKRTQFTETINPFATQTELERKVLAARNEP